MMPELVKAANQESSIKIGEVTSLSTVCDMINETSIGKVMFSEVHQLIRLYLTVPMTQERLNHVIMLHAHKNRTDEIELTEIAKEFVSFNERSVGFFGHF